jgi:hypothetical protein
VIPSSKKTEILRFVSLFAILLFLGSLGDALSQSTYVWVRGKVVDETTGKEVPHAQIASFGTFSIYAADSLGRFSISLPSTDSIRVMAMGFAPRTLMLGKLKSTQNLTIELSESGYDLDEIIVYNVTANEHLQKYMPSDIKLGYVNPIAPGLRADSEGGGPIGLVYKKLSRREKKKAQMREMIVAEKAQARMTKLLVAQLTGLEPPELDRFFVYCNATIKIAPNHPDSFIRARILDAYANFTANDDKDENDKVEN